MKTPIFLGKTINGSFHHVCRANVFSAFKSCKKEEVVDKYTSLLAGLPVRIDQVVYIAKAN